MFVIFVTTAFVRRRNTLPRSLIFLLFFVPLAFLLDDADAAADDVAVLSVDLRPLSFDFGFSAVVVAFSDERVRRTTALAVSTLRLFLKAKFVPTELMVVLLVDTTLKPRELPFPFCFSRIFLRFGNNFLFLLFGFGAKFGKIWRTARLAGKLANIRWIDSAEKVRKKY